MGLFDIIEDIVTMPVRVAVDVVKLPVKVINGEDVLLENTSNGIKKLERDLEK